MFTFGRQQVSQWKCWYHNQSLGFGYSALIFFHRWVPKFKWFHGKSIYLLFLFLGCRVTMVGHTNTVRCVQMSHEKEIVISGSYDETIKIWCLKTGRCQETLRGHHGRVLCMYVPWESHPGLILSGTYIQSIFWIPKQQIFYYLIFFQLFKIFFRFWWQMH